MTKIARELLFIKNSGVLIGEITPETDRSTLNLDSFVVKMVELDEDAGDYWYGDYTTGEVRSRADKPVITESYVKYNTNVSILNEYPIHKQLNIIIDMLDRSEIAKTSEFTALKEFLEAAKQNHREQIASYSANAAAFTFVSEAEEKEIIAKKQNFE
jgi:hypothetical protein